MKHTLIAALLLCLALPGWSLVDPEVEAWAEMVQDVQQALELPGTSMLGEGLEEIGVLGTALARAPLSKYMVELEQRRGLKFKYFTPWHIKDKKELRKFIAEQLAKEYTPKDIEQTEAMLKALRLVSLDFELVPFMEDLLTDQVGGAYDPATDQFFLVDTSAGQPLKKQLANKATRMLMDMSSVLIIHELDHALGGQHFPLKSFFDELAKNWTLDQEMAAMALVEGDATFVMLDHQRQTSPSTQGSETMILNADMMTQMVSAMAEYNLPGMGMDGFAKAPLFFQRSLIFPYYNGAEFVSSLRHSMVGGQTSGWGLVNNAYDPELLPSSTEQVYHPHRYTQMARAPKSPDLSGLPKKLGPWRQVHLETGGEFLLRVVLEQNGISNFRVLADGWNGDRLAVYSHTGAKQFAFYWVIRWDTLIHPEQFALHGGKSLPFEVSQESGVTFISGGFDPKQRAALRKALGSSL